MRPRPEQPTTKLILRDLELGPATVNELEETIGVGRRNLRYYMRMLYGLGAVKVVGWEQRTGPALPVYGVEGSEKQRPKRKYKRY
jgi:DNA-binding transcriptional ArsR family regulator